MKNRGLLNRFPAPVRTAWQDHYECMICGKNQWDCLHHIISKSSSIYIPGDHNRSILNSAPIHNFAHPNDMAKMNNNHYCHYGNEAFLYRDLVIVALLHKTIRALMSIKYQFNERDNMFLHVYSELYLMETPDVLPKVEHQDMRYSVENSVDSMCVDYV